MDSTSTSGSLRIQRRRSVYLHYITVHASTWSAWYCLCYLTLN
jgi:hypothetical protein